MGRINNIWYPKYWKIILEGKSKILKDDIICKMIIGDGEDQGYFEITEFISKYNYKNIINGNYTIKIFPYAELPVLLFDESKNLVPLVKGTEIPLNKLNTIQKEYINNINNKSLNDKKLRLRKHAEKCY